MLCARRVEQHYVGDHFFAQNGWLLCYIVTSPHPERYSMYFGTDRNDDTHTKIKPSKSLPRICNMNRLTLSIVIVVLLNTLCSFGQSNTECSNDEVLAVLEIQLDDNADETGYTLLCDNEMIWNVPIGGLSDQPAGLFKIERSCIRSDVLICNFTLSDNGRDGITGSENGFLTLSYGAATVAYLEYGKVAPFKEFSFCFGPACDSPMIEELDEDDDDAKYDWDKINFNDTESNEDGTDVDSAGEWVVNVTNKTKDESEDDRDESGVWLANVTIFGNEEDPKIEKDVDPNNTTSTTPKANDPSTSIQNDSYSPSVSSLVVIVSVVGSIFLGLLGMVILYKCWYRKTTTSGRDIRRVEHVLPVYNNKNDRDDDDDDEKSKDSHHHHDDNVRAAETFVTSDSSDNGTVVHTRGAIH